MSNASSSSSSSPEPCDGGLSARHGIPYLLFPDDPNRVASPITNTRDDDIRFWIHFGLVIFGFLLAIINFVPQLFKPIPYGRHASSSGRLPVPTRIANMIVNLVPSVVFFVLTYFLAGQNSDQPPNIVFFCLWIIHFLERGLVAPLVFKYSQTKVALWIPLSSFLAYLLYSYINAEFIGSAHFCDGFLYDPRFIIGLVLFIIGFIINRIADYQLVFLRKTNKDTSFTMSRCPLYCFYSCRDYDTKYAIPRGPLYFLITCPNYFGEGLQWFGWTIMTWSLSGLVWWLFAEATFIPRSRQNHKWLKNQHLDYPKFRKALIPFIY